MTTKFHQPDASVPVSEDNTEMLQIFMHYLPTQIQSLRAACDAHDALQIAQLAHMLRGSCAMIGVVEMNDLCREVETSARSGDMAHADGLLQRLERQFTSLAAQIAGELERRVATHS